MQYLVLRRLTSRACTRTVGQVTGRIRSFSSLLSVLGVVALGTLVAATTASAAGKDYGDAPDGSPTRYITKRGVTGQFPALEASNGARHTAPGALRLGPGVDAESESLQVNRDAHDDGFFASLSACQASTVSFAVDASRLPASSLASGHTAYLNAWFDWTRDGDWADSDRCAAEWAVQNFPLDMASFAAEPKQVITVPITAGAQVQEFWSRATLTLDEPTVSPVGKGLFANGETEDNYTIRGRFLNARCVPQSAFGVHGRRVRVKFVMKKIPGGGPIGVRLLNKALPQGIRLNFGPGGFTVRSRKDKPERFESFTLRFRIANTTGSISIIRCYVMIYHAKPKTQQVPPQRPVPPDGECPKGSVRRTEPSTLTVSVNGNNCGRTIQTVSFPLGQLNTSFDRLSVGEVDNPFTHDQRQWTCAPRASFGGVPDISCHADPPVPRDSFFDVFFSLNVSPLPQLGGQLSGTTSEGTQPDTTFGITPS